MPKKFIQVSEKEGEEIIELPVEEDGTLSLSTLQAQFPYACGLSYRYSVSGLRRGLRFNEGRFYPPSIDVGWGIFIYFCVFPKEYILNINSALAPVKHIITKCQITNNFYGNNN